MLETTLNSGLTSLNTGVNFKIIATESGKPQIGITFETRTSASGTVEVNFFDEIRLSPSAAKELVSFDYSGILKYTSHETIHILDVLFANEALSPNSTASNLEKNAAYRLYSAMARDPNKEYYDARINEASAFAGERAVIERLQKK